MHIDAISQARIQSRPWLSLAIGLATLIGTSLEKVLAAPTIIQDVRVQDLDVTPFLGRGYSIATNTFQSSCLSDIKLTQPSFNFSYDFIQLKGNTQSSRTLQTKVSGQAYQYVRGIVASSKKSIDTTSQSSTQQQSKHLTANLRVFTFYASVDEANSSLSDNARSLLKKADLPGFFAACGPYYIRGITRNAEFTTVFTWVQEASSSSSQTTTANTFGANLEQQLKAVSRRKAATAMRGGNGLDSMLDFQGCYGDSSRRDLEHFLGNFTIAECAAEALLQKYDFIGSQCYWCHGGRNVAQCFASNRTSRNYGKQTCSNGGKKDTNGRWMGGGWMNAVYKIKRPKLQAGTEIPKSIKESQAFAKQATSQSLTITSRGWGLGKKIENSLISYDVGSFRQAIKDAFQSMIEPLTGLAHSMEVIPWVENSEFQNALSIEGEDILDGVRVPLYKKKDILIQNAEYLQEVWSAARNKLNAYYKASLCYETLRSKWYKGNSLDATVAKTPLLNTRTMKPASNPPVTIATLDQKFSQEKVVDKYLKSYQSFMYKGAGDITAARCIKDMLKDPTSRAANMQGAIRSMAAGTDRGVRQMMSLGANTAAERITTQGRGIYLKRYTEHKSCKGLRERFVDQNVLDKVIDDYCVPRTIYEAPSYDGMTDN